MKKEILSAIISWIENTPPTIQGYYDVEAELVAVNETSTAIDFTVRLHKKAEVKRKSKKGW